MKRIPATLILVALCGLVGAAPPISEDGTAANPFQVNSAFSVSWDANPPEENVVGYRLYEWLSGNPAMVAEVTSPPVNVLNVPLGSHVYTATALNSSQESAHSQQMFVMVTDRPRPGKPLKLRIVAP